MKIQWANWKKIMPWVIMVPCFAVLLLPAGWISLWWSVISIILLFPAMVMVAADYFLTDTHQQTINNYDKGYQDGLKEGMRINK